MTEFDQHFRESLKQRPGSFGNWDLRIPDFSIWDWYTFLLSLASFGTITFGGTLFGSDFMLILGIAAVLSTNYKVLFYKPVRWLLILGGLWLASQMVTDIVTHSAVEDLSRGWLKIILSLAYFSVIWVLVHNSKRRIVLYLLGMQVAGALRILTFKGPEYIADPWKFGWAFPASVAALLWVTYMMQKKYSIYYLAPLVTLALINTYEGFRSQAFVLMMTAVVTHGFKSLSARGKTLSKSRLTLIFSAVLIAGILADLGYSYAAGHMWLGEQSYNKYEAQGGSAGGVLLGGRSELLSSTAAIADSPILGHGSWRRDPKYLWIMVKRMRELGYRRLTYDAGVQADAQTGTIPTHSHLMGSWVDAGIFGGIFWMYVLYILGSFLANLNGTEPFLALALFYVVTLSWDILFSPYAADRRFSAMFFLALIMAIQYQKDRLKDPSIERTNHTPEPVFANS